MKKIYIETLGCPKNWVDSEKLIGAVPFAFEIVQEAEQAEIIIVNTCTFIEASRIESIDTIIELGQLKETGKCNELIVSGCLVESYKEELIKELPEVDHFLKPDEVTQYMESIAITNQKISNVKRSILSENPLSNYLKISEGCNHQCSFCTIPQFKGKLKSRKLDDLIDEAKWMAAQGIKEINLVGQDLSAYGSDLDSHNLEILLRELVKIEDIEWIRMLYLYPTTVTKELIQIVKSEEKIANYFDIPLQYLEDRILKSMKRQGSVSQYKDLVDHIRQEIEEAAIRSTLIVGFPGETEEIYNILLDNINLFQFNHLGAFKFSSEESTVSFNLENHVDEDLKEQRLKEVMKLQANISEKHLNKRVNKNYKILLEEFVEGNDENPHYYIGRSELEAPEIDGSIVISSLDEIKVPCFKNVSIKSASEYDLYGVFNKEVLDLPVLNHLNK